MTTLIEQKLAVLAKFTEAAGEGNNALKAVKASINTIDLNLKSLQETLQSRLVPGVQQLSPTNPLLATLPSGLRNK